MKLIAYLSTILALAVAAQAQTNDPAASGAAYDTNVVAALAAKPVKTMSLQDCIQEALHSNLGLQIERYNPQLSLYSLRASYGAYDPTLSASAEHTHSEAGSSFNPSTGFFTPGTVSKSDQVAGDIGGMLPFGTTYDLFANLNEGYGVQSVSNRFDNTRGQVGISGTQPLLRNFWMNSSRLNVLVAKNRLKYSDAGLRLKLMSTISQVEDAYYDLIAAQEKVKVQEKGVELAQQLLTENKKRVEVGALAPLDEKQAESQLATAKADMLSARQTLDSQQNTLKGLMTVSYRDFHDTDIQPAESLAAPVQFYNLQDSWAKAMNQRPELLQARLDADQQGIQLKYQRNQLFPQLDLFGSYGYNAGGASTVTFDDGVDDFQRANQPFWSYGVKFSIPLTSQATRNNYKAAKVSLQQYLLIYKQLEQSILTQVDNDIIAARAGYERVAATRDASVYAQAALEAEQKKLENGKSTSFNVLSLQKDLTSARSAEIQALADYNKALTTLAQDEGSTLERRSVDLRTK